MLARWLILLLALVAIIGCGGKKGAATPTTYPQISITWPARSKASTFNGISSAESVVIVFTSQGNSNEVSTIAVDRASNPAGYTQGYFGNNKIPLGELNYTVSFYPYTGGLSNSLNTAHPPVGVASGTATIKDLGGELYDPTGSSALTGVTVLTEIRTVSITIGGTVVNPPTTSSVQVGQTLQLGFQPFDANGNLVAVTEGSEEFGSSNNSIASLTPPTQSAGWILTGNKVGSVTLQVAIDGVGNAITVNVTAAPVTPSVNVAWGARTRDVQLTSALSVAITVNEYDNNNNLLGTATGSADRPTTTLSATTAPVLLNAPLPVTTGTSNTITITASFYDQTLEQIGSGTPEVVGTYTLSNAGLNGAGAIVAGSNSITVDGQQPVITSVVLSQPSSMHVGDTYQFTFTCLDSSNQPLANVSQGSASYTVGDSSIVSIIQPYGLIQAQKVGTTTVNCTIDGVKSNTITVTVN